MGYEVRLPHGGTCLYEGQPNTRPAREWIATGVARIDGKKIPDKLLDAPAFILTPGGAYGPMFLVFENFMVLKRYNFADLYAVFVGHLADRMAGGGNFATAWTTPKIISTKEIEEIQERLKARGLPIEKIDGKAGMNTRNLIGHKASTPRSTAGRAPTCSQHTCAAKLPENRHAHVLHRRHPLRTPQHPPPRQAALRNPRTDGREVLIARWNTAVGPQDIVYIGDFAYRGAMSAEAYRARLNGEIHLVAGNHDVKVRKGAPGIFASIHDIAEVKIAKDRNCCPCDYPMREWPGAGMAPGISSDTSMVASIRSRMATVWTSASTNDLQVFVEEITRRLEGRDNPFDNARQRPLPPTEAALETGTGRPQSPPADRFFSLASSR